MANSSENPHFVYLVVLDRDDPNHLSESFMNEVNFQDHVHLFGDVYLVRSPKSTEELCNTLKELTCGRDKLAVCRIDDIAMDTDELSKNDVMRWFISRASQ